MVYTLALHAIPTGWIHALFWADTLLALGAIALIVRLGCRTREGGLLAILTGALFYLPKFFRSPHFFNFHDELAHWYATNQLLAGHGPFVFNPDNLAVQYYPGLHVLTAVISSTTGLSIFAAGNILCAWAHMTVCLAIYGLSRQLGGSPGTALTAVMLYAASPTFFYFDAQFSYETLGLVFFAVVLACAIRMSSPGEQVAWAEAGLACILAVALVVTHHITSYLLAASLTVLAGTCWILRRRAPVPGRTLRQLTTLAAIAAVANLAWLLTVAPYTLAYLRGPIAGDLTAVADYFRAGGHTSRQLFSGAGIPSYEVFGSYAAVLVLFGLYASKLAGLRRREMRLDPRQWVLLLLGGLYFASLPVVFVFNDQTTKRPWTFAFAGLAVLCAPDICRLLSGRTWLAWFGGAGLLAIIYVGGVVTFSGQDIRFPGSYNAGSDSLATTPDLIAAAYWLDAQYGNGNPFIGDATIAQVVGSYGRQDPRTYENFGYRPWDVIFPERLRPAVYTELHRDDARFIIIDRRIATQQSIPRDYYFNAAEPDAWHWDTAVQYSVARQIPARAFQRDLRQWQHCNLGIPPLARPSTLRGKSTP